MLALEMALAGLGAYLSALPHMTGGVVAAKVLGGRGHGGPIPPS